MHWWNTTYEANFQKYIFVLCERSSTTPSCCIFFTGQNPWFCIFLIFFTGQNPWSRLSFLLGQYLFYSGFSPFQLQKIQVKTTTKFRTNKFWNLEKHFCHIWANIFFCNYQFLPNLCHAALYRWCCPQQTYQACLKINNWTYVQNEQAMMTPSP